MPVNELQTFTRRQSKTDHRTKPTVPPMCKVLLLNDDFTPMDFVVKVLEFFFNKTHSQAITIMLKVHHEGVALCGIYPQDIAQTKAQQVKAYAQSEEHPLQCVLELA